MNVHAVKHVHLVPPLPLLRPMHFACTVSGEILQTREPYKPRVEDLREEWLVTQLRFLQLLQPLLNNPDQDELRVRDNLLCTVAPWVRGDIRFGWTAFCSFILLLKVSHPSSFGTSPVVPVWQRSVEQYRFRPQDGQPAMGIVDVLFYWLRSALDTWSGVDSDSNRDSGESLSHECEAEGFG